MKLIKKLKVYNNYLKIINKSNIKKTLLSKKLLFRNKILFLIYYNYIFRKNNTNYLLNVQ